MSTLLSTTFGSAMLYLLQTLPDEIRGSGSGEWVDGPPGVTHPGPDLRGEAL